VTGSIVLGRLACLALAVSAIVTIAMPRAAQALPFSPDALYAAQCSSCHGDRMEGGQFGPTLKGQAFRTKWTGKGEELFHYISHNMPPNSSGQLGEADYRVLTKLLADANRLDRPAGSADAAPEPQRVGHLGPRSAPELWRDATAERASAAQAAKLAALTPVTAQMLRTPPAEDWLTWRRNQDLTGFSPLDQINRQTAGGLKLKWAWSMKPGRNELAPLVHDGVMFIHNADEVQALDAATGTLLWRYVRDVEPQYRGPFNMVERSFSMLGTMLYVATPDRHVIALDARTGKLVWDTEIIPPTMQQAGLSSGPYVAGNTIVQGTSMGPFCKGGCYVTGLDPATGKKLWRFDNVAKTGKAGETWNGLPPEERTGAATWNGGSYDPDLDLLFFGTAGTYDVSSLLDPGPKGKVGANAALYTNSTIALRPSTGELVWYHQHMPRELWDLDEVFERMLVTVPVDGKERKAVIEIGKMGILDALDRQDGRYLFSVDLGLQNVVTAIDPGTGRRTVDPAKIPARDKPVLICPSVDGVRNWMATAYNPSTRILYVPALEVCMDFVRSVGDDGVDGKLDMGWVFRPRPDTDGKYGRIQAIDLATRKTLWVKRNRPLTSSSLLDTAGGVLFQGDTYRGFGAMDDRTGETLWETRLDGNPSSTPITFSAGGRQYVAVVTGGGGGHDITTPDMTPEEQTPAAATTIWVFGL
jgi:alcohol dehydrogenase (cytochrome c)